MTFLDGFEFRKLLPKCADNQNNLPTFHQPTKAIKMSATMTFCKFLDES